MCVIIRQFLSQHVSYSALFSFGFAELIAECLDSTCTSPCIWCVNARLVSEILRESGDSTEVELTRDGQWHVTKTEDFDCPSPEPNFVQNILDSKLLLPCVVWIKGSIDMVTA